MSASTILVIDDEATAREFAQTHLENEGYNVLMADSVNRAIEILSTNKHLSLVICDINMPDKDGFDFLNYLNTDLRYACIPLIFSTGRADAQSVRRAKAMGARGFLAKPFLGEDLLKRVKYTLKSGKGVVLLVSQDQLSLNNIARHIFVAHYMPLMATRVEDAHELMKSRQIDFLVTDLYVGAASGMDLVVDAKASFFKVCALVVKGSQDTISEEELISAGADVVLQKPLRNIDIIRKLEQAMLKYKAAAVKEYKEATNAK
ncbi:MAG: response regulator [Candidatus Zixiibacteriota bacterium]